MHVLQCGLICGAQLENRSRGFPFLSVLLRTWPSGDSPRVKNPRSAASWGASPTAGRLELVGTEGRPSAGGEHG